MCKLNVVCTGRKEQKGSRVAVETIGRSNRDECANGTVEIR